MLHALQTVLKHAGLRVTTMMLFMMGFIFAATLPYISIIAIDQLEMSPQLFGVVLLFNALIGTFGVVAISHFADQTAHRKPVILTSFAIGAVGFGSVAVWPSVVTLTVCLLLFFPFVGAAYSQLYAIVRSIALKWNLQEAGAINSAVRSIYAMSWILVPGLVGLYLAWSERASDAFGVAAVVLIFCLVVFARFGADPTNQTAKDKPKEGLAVAFRLIASGQVWPRVGSLALIGVAHPINATVLPLLILDIDGATTRDVGIIAGLVAALEVPFMLIGGALLTRIPIVWVIVGGGLIHAFYVLSLAFAQSMAHIYGLSLLNAAGAAVLLSVHLSYLQDTMPERPGLGTSLLSISGLLQRGLSASIIAGVGLLFGLTGALVIAAVAGFAGAATLVVVSARAR